MPGRSVRATMAPSADGWWARIHPTGEMVEARGRAACLAALRRRIGPEDVLTVEITPDLVGVAEAAAILGWDKRRVITYVDRGVFPEPVVRLASGRVWRREDIEAFGRTRDRRAARKRAG